MNSRLPTTRLLSMHRQQSGAVLLAFLLVLITGASFILISKLNKATQASTRTAQSQVALKQAKELLIGYAVTYPDNVNSAFGPGYLPCPDIDNNGLAGSSCSFNGSTTIGRIPRETLEMNNIKDASGEVLWYALSDNFRNNPKLEPLNSETPGTLTVDGRDDIVAVLFAAGPATGSQDRENDVNDKTDFVRYLEGENADGDQVFSSTGTGEFNDQLVTISRTELMQAVERRVLAEADNILTAYRAAAGGFYPWLSPFADPKVMTPVIAGSASSTLTSPPPILSDSSAQFVSWGVRVGDVVLNRTNNALGQVVSVDSETQLTTGSLSGVSSNEFQSGDDYVIRPSGSGFVARYTGVASGASGGDILVDTTGEDFDDRRIRGGMIVENTTTNFSGVIEQLDPDEDGSDDKLRFENPAANAFVAGDDYRARLNLGVATFASANLTLQDSTLTRNFVARGIVPGDVVENLTDGSVGRVDSVTSNSIVVSSLRHGTTNVFANGDVYQFSRFNGLNGTREGLLPLHQYGQPFASAFTAAWSMPVTGTTVSSVSNDLAVRDSTQDTLYWTVINDFLRSSSIINASSNEVGSGPRTVTRDNGNCVWWGEQIADCRGVTIKEPYLIGTIDTKENGGKGLRDNSSDFPQWGVEVGDIVRNYTETIGSAITGTVTPLLSGNATAGSGAGVLENTAENFVAKGITALDYTVVNDTSGQQGQVLGVTNTQLTTAATISFATGNNYSVFHSDGNLLVDTTKNFVGAGVLPYDYKVTNTTTGEEGVVEIVGTSTLSVINMDGGSMSFAIGDAYTLEQVSKGAIVEVTETTLRVEELTGGKKFKDNGVYGVSIATERISSQTDIALKFGSTWVIRDVVNTRNYALEGVTTGDVIINTTTGEIGTVIIAGAGGIIFTEVEFSVGDNYTIRHHYVNYRQYDFSLRYKASSTTSAFNGGERTRDVTLSGTLPAQTTRPLITITDNLQTGHTITNTLVIPDAASLPSGNLSLTGLYYGLSTDTGEVPDWFVNNDWHRLMYFSVAAALAPGGGGDCTGDGSCLVLDGRAADDGSIDSIVISMGRARVAQDRSTGAITDYLDSNNASTGDDDFIIENNSATYNDQIRIVE